MRPGILGFLEFWASGSLEESSLLFPKADLRAWSRVGAAVTSFESLGAGLIYKKVINSIYQHRLALEERQ